MRKWLVLFLILTPLVLYAAGSKFDTVTPEARDEGDSPLFINVACPKLTPDGWQPVASSDTIRRVLFVQTDYMLQAPICLGTAIALGTSPICNTGFQGLILGTNLSSISIYTKNAWTCASATLVTGTLHGYIGRDKRDYGNIGAQGLQ